MDIRLSAILLVIVVVVPLFSGCLEDDSSRNEAPLVEIVYPYDGTRVSNLVMISGTATDPDGDEDLVQIELQIGDDEWIITQGTDQWSYDWLTYSLEDGPYALRARAWDGKAYSAVEEITVILDNPETVASDAHQWALFVAVANFPEDNESKLGNGGLFLAEEMAAYFIQEYGYATSNIILLFDDGWIRADGGYGKRVQTLQQRYHEYNIIYGGATRKNVEASITYIVEEANQYEDSEVFLWFFGHGHGDNNNTITGGKLLERSALFLWDTLLTDKELGTMLSDLRSTKTCVIVDACFSGGFSDKTIYNFPTFFLLRSGIPQSGRVVMSGASKFRVGYASTTQGPLFSLLWFEGLQNGNADGYRPGIRQTGRPTRLRFFKDGAVSVEEAFYYARYMLKHQEDSKEYSTMESQITDYYPHRGLLRSRGGLVLGQ